MKVLSAESEDELYKSVKAWVVQRHPDAKPLTQEFRYVPDDRALFILRTLSKDGEKRAFYFETPGLPFQFVGSK